MPFYKQELLALKYGKKGNAIISLIENTASEVVSSVISWATTLVVLNSIHEREQDIFEQEQAALSCLMQQSRLESSSDQRIDHLGMIAQVGENINRGFDRLFGAIAEEKNEQRRLHEDRMEQHHNTRRTGRFGVDELFDEASEASSKNSKSKIKKRTVRAGFWLETEVSAPDKKRRKGILNGFEEATQAIGNEIVRIQSISMIAYNFIFYN